MNAVTIHQPYATAIALGLKHFETRSWGTNYRGPLAIHSGKTMPKWAMEFARTEVALGRIPKRLPLGAVVCIADLIEIIPAAEAIVDTDAIERLYGDFSPGRWAWRLTNVRVLAEPIFAVGKQGLWNWPTSIEELQFKDA